MRQHAYTVQNVTFTLADRSIVHVDYLRRDHIGGVRLVVCSYQRGSGHAHSVINYHDTSLGTDRQSQTFTPCTAQHYLAVPYTFYPSRVDMTTCNIRTEG